jgi:hypothetical protein
VKILANEENAKEYLIKELYEVTADFHPREYRKHKITMLEGIIIKLDQLALECSECNRYFNDFETDIINKLEPFNNTNQREYHLNLKKIMAHLRSKHQLVVGGYYAELSISGGILIGFLLGLIMDNLGVGVAIGFVMGVAVGVGLETVAKKKGNVILTPPRQP